MQSTGFDIRGLLGQIEASPRAKDWEIGEAIAEIALEDVYEAMFPWSPGLDKRTQKASLPGPDLVDLQCFVTPRFMFGQVKTSSEEKVPPQVVNSTQDCLQKQMFQLQHCAADRQQVIGWLLVRMRDTEWEDAFNEAIQRYAEGIFELVGVLVSGKRKPNEKDLAGICAGLEHQPGMGRMLLLGFYLPFHKIDWVEIIYGRVTDQ